LCRAGLKGKVRFVRALGTVGSTTPSFGRQRNYSMAQIALIGLALTLFWEGAKGFRSTGIKFGLLKAEGEPIKGTKGKVIGSCVICVGLVCLFFALVYIPYLSGIW
jgi:hypothetical protein